MRLRIDRTGRSKPRPFQVTSVMPLWHFMAVLNAPRIDSSISSAAFVSLGSRHHLQVVYASVKRYLGTDGSMSMVMSIQATATTRWACGAGNGSTSATWASQFPCSLDVGTTFHWASPGVQTVGSGMVSMSNTRKIMAAIPPHSRQADGSIDVAETRSDSGTASGPPPGDGT